jgi:hypothetical protein
MGKKLFNAEFTNEDIEDWKLSFSKELLFLRIDNSSINNNIAQCYLYNSEKFLYYKWKYKNYVPSNKNLLFTSESNMILYRRLLKYETK